MSDAASQQRLNCVFRSHLVLIFLFFLLIVGAQAGDAQQFSVIHSFTGGSDGGYPYAGLTIDAQGNLYGTAFSGGAGQCPPQNIGCGTVFELTPTGSNWSFNVLYSFRGGTDDGGNPSARVTFGPDGNLYGSTGAGGMKACLSGCGVVFSLSSSKTCRSKVCPWTETVLHRFAANAIGFYPSGDLTFDQFGNIYGTTFMSSNGPGAVYRLDPSKDGWQVTSLYEFVSDFGPANPDSGVIVERSGNVFGTTMGQGAVFELIPLSGQWKEKNVHGFRSSAVPVGGLIFGPSGDLIGATNGPGAAVFELSDAAGKWTRTTLYRFPRWQEGSAAQLIMDGAGNLYGTTEGFPPEGTWGTVFKLTNSGGTWTETVLHEFTGGSDGGMPVSNLVLDSHGNLYGTTSVGGPSNYGVVFEIKP